MENAGDPAGSSYIAIARGVAYERLAPHPACLARGIDTTSRANAYRAIVEEATPAVEFTDIRDYLQQQRAHRVTRFQRPIERETLRCAAVRLAHRPGNSIWHRDVPTHSNPS